ncbi:hypothetical protein NB2BOR_A21070 [Bordetella parapertussis]|nr:hypothetical protein NB2BOR_A21070 [Bordetella parapertussis]
MVGAGGQAQQGAEEGIDDLRRLERGAAGGGLEFIEQAQALAVDLLQPALEQAWTSASLEPKW